MSLLEQRYRRVLRVLPAFYREVWKEEMVATFLESAHAEYPDLVETDDAGLRPNRAEVAGVAALAVRLRLGGAHGATTPVRDLGRGPPSGGAGVAAHQRGDGDDDHGDDAVAERRDVVASRCPEVGFRSWEPSLWDLVLLLTVPVYFALVFGYRGVAKLLALLAFLPSVVMVVSVAMNETADELPSAMPLLWFTLLIEALPVLVLVAFHHRPGRWRSRCSP